MHTRSRHLFSLLLAVFTSTAACQASEWTVLMDGTSLDAWRGYQSDEIPKAWKINLDGELTLEPADAAGGEGSANLTTRRQFGDFELEFEWKISAGGNSGVMYLVTEDGAEPFFSGPEYQVLDDANYEGVDESQRAGALYGLYDRLADASKPAGEWNTARIVHNAGRVEHWLNGQRVAAAIIGSDEWNERVAATKFAEWPTFAASTRGHIVLQDHGCGVWYRNVRVRELTGKRAAAADKPSRLLFVTQSAGFKHSSVTRKASDLSHAERIMQRLGVESGAFRVDCTQDVANDFTPELLAEYDVVAFYTTGDLPIPEETLAWFLEDWLADQGHAVLGVHSATDTYQDHEPFWDMIGGTFDGHPWNSETPVVLKVHAADHPASKPFGLAGTRIALKEEIYQHKHWQPEKVRVLMSLDMQQTELKKPRHIPVLWVKKYGAGRVMHLSLGHREDVWERPDFQASLVGGVKWLLGKAPGDATPNPELSSAEQQLAEQAAAAPATGG
ncbi:MAG: family 16 glycoside hydrolase [Planctomycetota bacterium]